MRELFSPIGPSSGYQMLSILTLGFLLGIQHALEADHIAAVAAITAGRSRLSGMLRHGLFWGIGHALTLSILAGGVVLARGQIPVGLSASLEFLVGLMLIALGGMVIWRLVRQQMHFHLHNHRDGKKHFHLHNHTGETQPHDKNRHHHEHPVGGTKRSLFVGVMHGMAGSAALVALAAPGEWLQGFGYVVLFAIGSIAGMAMLTCVVALPLAFTSKAVTGLNRGLQAAVGGISIFIGSLYAFDHATEVVEYLAIF